MKSGGLDKSLEKIGIKRPDLSNMDTSEKKALCVSMLRHGFSPTVLAKYFGVSRKTIYAWKADERNEIIQELETLKHIDVFADQLSTLEDYEALALKMAARAGQGAQVYDPELDKMVTKSGSFRDFAELMKVVLKFREMIVNLHITVGNIPRQPENIQRRLSDYSKVVNESSESSEDNHTEPDMSRMSREELKEMTLKNLANQLIL